MEWFIFKPSIVSLVKCKTVSICTLKHSETQPLYIINILGCKMVGFLLHPWNLTWIPPTWRVGTWQCLSNMPFWIHIISMLHSRGGCMYDVYDQPLSHGTIKCRSPQHGPKDSAKVASNDRSASSVAATLQWTLGEWAIWKPKREIHHFGCAKWRLRRCSTPFFVASQSGVLDPKAKGGSKHP